MVEVDDQVFPVFLFFSLLFIEVFFSLVYVNFIEQLFVSFSLCIVRLLSALLQLNDREHRVAGQKEWRVLSVWTEVGAQGDESEHSFTVTYSLS